MLKFWIYKIFDITLQFSKVLKNKYYGYSKGTF